MGLRMGIYETTSLALFGLNENEIAERLGLALSSVSRYIAQACRETFGLSLALVRQFHRQSRPGHRAVA